VEIKLIKLIQSELIKKFKTTIIEEKLATFMDDICEGICPFRFIDKFPYPDAPEITLDWCELLVDLESPLLSEYIEKGLFFHFFTSIAKSITSPIAISQLYDLSIYLKKKYDFNLKI